MKLLIREARKLAGLTQAAAAEKAAISARAVWLLENGGGSMESLHQLATAIDFRIAGLGRGRSFGEQVRAARLRRGWTMAQAGTKAGIDQETVAMIERDRGHVESFTKLVEVIATQVRRRASEKSAFGSGKRDERFTPTHFLDKIVESFGPISIDPCAHADANVVADRYLTVEDDGLSTTWSGDLAYVNPPYSDAAKWLERCHRAWERGECRTVVTLVPARTHIRAYANYVHDIADVVMIKGRLQFDNANLAGGFPLGLMAAAWGAADHEIERLRERVPGPFIPGRSRRQRS